MRIFAPISGDFYSVVAGNITGKPIRKKDPKRAIFKTVLLGVINGITAVGLRKQLRCSRSEAEGFIRQFFETYPDVESYLALLKMQIALTGQTCTWAGRVRTVSAHRWMVSEPRVRVLLTYADGHRYWFDVVPLVPTLRFLTSYVLRIWSVSDPRRPLMIFDHAVGRIGKKFYKQIDEPLLYSLPIRNLPWSNIRQVQRVDAAGVPIEQARYEGLDATARSAINAVMQGGTADLAFRMMLRSRHLARHFGASLILQVHDELVWECPEDRAAPFLRAVKSVLERPPSRDFAVPIRVSLKWGRRFGEMEELESPPRPGLLERICLAMRPWRRRLRRDEQPDQGSVRLTRVSTRTYLVALLQITYMSDFTVSGGASERFLLPNSTGKLAKPWGSTPPRAESPSTPSGSWSITALISRGTPSSSLVPASAG